MKLPGCHQHFQWPAARRCAKCFPIHFFKRFCCLRRFTEFNVNYTCNNNKSRRKMENVSTLTMTMTKPQNARTFAITRVTIFYRINLFNFAKFLECITEILFGILFIANNKQTCKYKKEKLRLVNSNDLCLGSWCGSI